MVAPRRAMARRADGGIVTSMRRDAANAPIEVRTLRGDLSVLLGSGGNIAVLHGSDGKFLVDAGITASKPQLVDALDKISGDPIRYLINTHWHFDHTDGNEWVHGAGATIIAHENTRKHLAETTRVNAWDFTFAPAPAGALPATTVRGPATLYINNATVAIDPFEPAHTDGDVRVTFAESDVVHVGDTWWNGHYPFIDYSTGGSIDGTIRATAANIGHVTDRTVVIPGHGPVGDKSQLVEYHDMLRTVRDAVAALKKQGRSIEETIAAKPTGAYDKKWGTFLIAPDTFTRLVYAGV
ncbi:MAG TPA: MBL fold metallo-hydrolase [Phycisphaerales bacterium]|nr:MBL fold metallo-hydrolase [Phycisphaerales bacterium]